jgi:GNAT superfamily N-acetyltransferase
MRPATRVAPRPTRISIREARTARETDQARALFLEYRQWLVTHREVTAFPDSVLQTGLRLFDEEIEGLPGQYARPRGALFIAYDGPTPVGCAALRPHEDATAEFKRLFVRPSRRSAGLGRRLTRRALQCARRLGYRRVVLDTLPRMVRAIALYRNMGFRPTEPYWAHPVRGAMFFEFRLE